jgi:hypothetical protein
MGIFSKKILNTHWSIDILMSFFVLPKLFTMNCIVRAISWLCNKLQQLMTNPSTHQQFQNVGLDVLN